MFNEHFSLQSEAYARYRPQYPKSLFRNLFSKVVDNKCAWDCGTGTGQVALRLVEHFDQVIASDVSNEQIKRAKRHEKIIYRVFPAEQTCFHDSSIDLVTVAQALHWFNINGFYKEVRRILKKEGVISVWTYKVPRINKNIDKILDFFCKDIVGDYWPPEYLFVDEGYKSIPFPFEKVNIPPIKMISHWSFSHLIGFISSWSAVQLYKNKIGKDPIRIIIKDLSLLWNDKGVKHEINWPLKVLVGRNVK